MIDELYQDLDESGKPKFAFVKYKKYLAKYNEELPLDSTHIRKIEKRVKEEKVKSRLLWFMKFRV